jgi:hypothetical protein
MSNETKHIETVYNLHVTREVVDHDYVPSLEAHGLHVPGARRVAETSLDVTLTPEQFALVKKAIIEQWT